MKSQADGDTCGNIRKRKLKNIEGRKLQNKITLLSH